MNISIDEKVLEKTKFRGNILTPSEFLLCIIVKLNNNITELTESLIEKNILVRDIYNSSKIYLRSDCSSILQQVLLESDKAVPKVTELDELVTKLQELFPKERKLDANGVPKYAYRGNKRDVTERLQKFFKLYGQYSYDDVLECTKRYVDSFKYDRTYMKILPYYIIKDGESTLATELENMDCNDTTTTNNDLNYGEALL